MIGDNRFTHSKGFSLLELVTVIGLLIVVGGIITSVYVQTLRIQRHASARQTMVSDIRNALETLAHHIKSGEVDYAYYDTQFGAPQQISMPQRELALILSDNSKIVYLLDQNQLFAERNGQLFRVTSPGVSQVVSFNVYIGPSTSPFREELCNSDAMCSAGSQQAGGCTETRSTEPIGLCSCDSDSDCQVTFRCQLSDDPLSASGICVPPDSQPLVTIAIGVQEIDPTGANEKVVYFQSTIASRVYRR